MIVVGLTGSIGMGKTTAAAMFRCQRVPVFDSDAFVHRLYAPGGAGVAAIAAIAPACVQNGAVDRNCLGAAVAQDPTIWSALEGLIHPLVVNGQRRFLRSASINRHRMAVLDIPLLFETGAQRRADAVIVVSAPGFVQRQRVLRRPGMTPERLRSILARQMPDLVKRRRADIVVPTGLGRGITFRALVRSTSRLRTRSVSAWHPGFGGRTRRTAGSARSMGN